MTDEELKRISERSEFDWHELNHHAHELMGRFITQTGRNHDDSARFEMHPKTYQAACRWLSGCSEPGTFGWQGFELLSVQVHRNPSVREGDLHFIPYVVTDKWRGD